MFRTHRSQAAIARQTKKGGGHPTDTPKETLSNPNSRVEETKIDIEPAQEIEPSNSPKVDNRTGKEGDRIVPDIEDDEKLEVLEIEEDWRSQL